MLLPSGLAPFDRDYCHMISSERRRALPILRKLTALFQNAVMTARLTK